MDKILNEKVKKNILIFNQNVKHYTAAAHPKDFPSLSLPEICFAGRSNVGKSSLINALCKKRALARTSNTPGRTQLIHFYNVENKLFYPDHYQYSDDDIRKIKKIAKEKKFEHNHY